MNKIVKLFIYNILCFFLCTPFYVVAESELSNVFHYSNILFVYDGLDRKDFVDKYNNYFFQLLLYHDYLTPELEKLLTTFVNRIYMIESDVNYTDNQRLVKEVDFYNSSLQQIDEINGRGNDGKNKSKKLIKLNPDGNSGYSKEEDYPDHSIEWYRPLSKTGYLNIFLNIFLPVLRLNSSFACPIFSFASKSNGIPFFANFFALI